MSWNIGGLGLAAMLSFDRSAIADLGMVGMTVAVEHDSYTLSSGLRWIECHLVKYCQVPLASVIEVGCSSVETQNCQCGMRKTPNLQAIATTRC